MENKKTKIISIVAIVALALTVITATYAYFTVQGGDATSTNLNVTTYTTDVFTFTTGDAINIALTQSDFASGAGNITGSTYASALLTANNKTNTATEHYYLYLNIEDNTFTYSINENTPEIIMTITDSAGAEVTDISTLNHVIVTGANGTQVSGYDITNKSGLITLFDNREITTTSSKEEKWNITITFVNYDANQNTNAGKNMNAKVLIQKEVIPYYESCNDNTLACHVAKLYTGTQGENNIYYHNGTIKSTTSFDVITNYEYNVTTTYPAGTVLDANDNSYRYAGASENVNNYICLGSTASPCPEENLYRIIGVFGDQVKVIKNEGIFGEGGDGYCVWDDGGVNDDISSNTWSTSSLNKYLNETYLTSLGTLSEMIATTTWKVGGNSIGRIMYSPMFIAYQYEIVNPEPGEYSTTGETEYKAKIGLMYVSDYGYAASPTYWTYPGYLHDESIEDGCYGCTMAYTGASSWLYYSNDWTITRVSDAEESDLVFLIDGDIREEVVSSSNLTRPSFNLISEVNYLSGSGNSNDPIRIN